MKKKINEKFTRRHDRDDKDQLILFFLKFKVQTISSITILTAGEPSRRFLVDFLLSNFTLNAEKAEIFEEALRVN